MITIKQFAKLCGCNTQTLRYYDKIDLLKPVKVDQWSGYRYYTESQAIDFVKIKNLQAADFTIEEIKALLTMPEDQVYEAFDRKIAEQTHKLERIKEIQQSYLTEVNSMKKLIHSFCDHLSEKSHNPDMLREFGMDTDAADKMVEAVRNLMFSKAEEDGESPQRVNVIVDEKVLEGPEAIEKLTFMIREEDMHDTVVLREENIQREAFRPTDDMEVIWEAHGWSNVHEILDDIPIWEAEKKYILLLHIYNKPFGDNLSFPLFMIGSLLLKSGNATINANCIVEHSKDMQNHITLFKKK